MWELDYKESCVPKNWCFWTVVLVKTLESPLYYKEKQPVHSKRDQSWVFIGSTDAKTETPILWPPHAKSWLIRKDPDAGKNWRQEMKGRQRTRWLVGITDSMDMVWVDSGSWWWTGRPGVLQSMGSQRVGHDWATKLNWLLLKLWRPSIPSYIHLNRSLNKTHSEGVIELQVYVIWWLEDFHVYEFKLFLYLRHWTVNY